MCQKQSITLAIGVVFTVGGSIFAILIHQSESRMNALILQLSSNVLIAGRLEYVVVSPHTDSETVDEVLTVLAAHRYPTGTIHLNDRQLSPEAISTLLRMTWLKGLNLARTNVTDSDLARFRRLTTLRTLSLTECNITDAGLVHLKAMRSLQQLGLEGTGITLDEVLKFQHERPDVDLTETIRSLERAVGRQKSEVVERLDSRN